MNPRIYEKESRALATNRPHKNSSSVNVNPIDPTSDLGEFPQPHQPRTPAAESAVVESDVVCRIQPPIACLRTRDLPQSSIQSRHRRKRAFDELLIPHHEHHKRRKQTAAHPDSEEPIKMPASQRPCTTTSNPAFTRKNVVQHPHERDQLDALIDRASSLFELASTWEEFASALRGTRSEFHSQVASLPHPAASLLAELSDVGASVETSTPCWNDGRKTAAMSRGPHKSARDHIEFLRQEFVDMINRGQWTILPARLLSDTIQLRLSPLGVVPQRDRRPRTICDYSFFGINDETLAQAPADAMQFGRALQRILQRIHRANPRLGPVFLSKIDIADGFYRVWLKASDIPKLAILFPSREGEEQLVGLPLTLPMGWKESPPYFCSTTETAADLANNALSRNRDFPAHRLDKISESTSDNTDPVKQPAPAPSNTPHYRKPIRYWDVYVDDFIGLVQGNRWRRRQVKRALFHSLDQVLRQLSPGDNTHRQEPASIKKMLKGDARWTTRKVVLGWIIDTIQGTVELPDHRIHRLHEILASIKPGQRRVAISSWHQVLGELRSMALAIPGARGLFSTLQEAFRHPEKDGNRLRLHKHVHDFLEDWRWLANNITARPTRIAEVIPSPRPHTIGACDAAGSGMGGVHFVTDQHNRLHPILWRQSFPKHVTQQLVSFDNPKGRITNSDLELAGTLAHHDVLVASTRVTESTVHTLSDNDPTVHWQTKGSTTTIGPAAYLLRLQALHSRYYKYLVRYNHIPGWANVMADICSRAWHLTDSQLLTYFNSHFPQDEPWQLYHLRPPMNSALISSLYRQRSELESLLVELQPKITIGDVGKSFATPTPSTLSYDNTQIQSPSCKSLDSAIETADLHPAVDKWHLEQWRTPYEQWHRRTPVWGPQTPAKTPTARSIFASLDSSEVLPKPIHRPSASSRSPSLSSFTSSA